MFEKLKLKLSNSMRSFLRIYETTGSQFQIDELLDFDSNVAVNRIWYRGESYELEQLYKQLEDNSFSFWGSVPTQGLEIRKIHTGLPKLTVDVLSGLVVDDMQELVFDSEADKNLWEEMDKENELKDLVKDAICDVLYAGDGAFKISIDTEISQYPIIEFYEADRINVVRKRKRIQEIVFKTPYKFDNKDYILNEHYGKGYVKYVITDTYDNVIPAESVPGLARYYDVEWEGNYMLAEYVRFYKSSKYEGRGQSIFDAKRDNYDSFDEIWSQWIDALRAGRAKSYIPENLIPRDPNTGALKKSNSFDNRFIALASALGENDQGKINVEQPNIPHESYLSAYITALDLCLQGIISPSTLGIDTKKLDNADAQREKEKTTLYTRNRIVTVLQKVLPSLIKKVFMAYQTLNKNALSEIDVDVPFGEYANPSFESQVETVGKAKSQGIMSTEAAVDELYGDTKDNNWKKEEVKRIREEAGITEMEEPMLV